MCSEKQQRTTYLRTCFLAHFLTGIFSFSGSSSVVSFHLVGERCFYGNFVQDCRCVQCSLGFSLTFQFSTNLVVRVGPRQNRECKRRQTNISPVLGCVAWSCEICDWDIALYADRKNVNRVPMYGTLTFARWSYSQQHILDGSRYDQRASRVTRVVGIDKNAVTCQTLSQLKKLANTY